MLFHCIRLLCRVVVDHRPTAINCGPRLYVLMPRHASCLVITTRFVLHSLIQASLSSSYNYSFFWAAPEFGRLFFQLPEA
ncbi:hypothetical protein QYF36_005889 [Acer negundo]|nr:hypothetical protein QYF36_005889 [Acer negundo]